MKPHLWIGNRNYSSWSLRAWLSLKWAGVEFDETLIELDQPGYGEQRIVDVLAVSPSGLVPALTVGGETLWDTLAIAEWAAEQGAEGSPAQPLVPQGRLQRALMRSVIGEMHAGFAALRRELPMNILRRCQARGLSAQGQADVDRIDALWCAMRERHATDGTFLFGARTLADAFYLPVATRFRTYNVVLSAPAREYCELLLSDTAFQRWEQLALAEDPKPFSRAVIDLLYPDSATMGTAA